MIEITISLWGEGVYVDFSAHARERSSERDVQLERLVMLSLDECKKLITENITDETFAVKMPLASFVAKRRVDNGIVSLDIITVMKGDGIKMFQGQRYFEIDAKGVSFNTFHKREDS
jgi:hypothetical protein